MSWFFSSRMPSTSVSRRTPGGGGGAASPPRIALITICLLSPIAAARARAYSSHSRRTRRENVTLAGFHPTSGKRRPFDPRVFHARGARRRFTTRHDESRDTILRQRSTYTRSRHCNPRDSADEARTTRQPLIVHSPYCETSRGIRVSDVGSIPPVRRVRRDARARAVDQLHERYAWRHRAVRSGTAFSTLLIEYRYYWC